MNERRAANALAQVGALFAAAGCLIWIVLACTLWRSPSTTSDEDLGRSLLLWASSLPVLSLGGILLIAAAIVWFISLFEGY